MFTKVLIANRGEIAVRIARACHDLGIDVVAVYSDADRLALHVRVADEAYRIGPPPARESYLNIDAILAAARESGAEAIHPGYGFLSESAVFAERIAAAGLVFIGPFADAIRAMGDKAEAKRLMIEAGVPVVPGYQGEAQGDELLRAEADRIGYPVLIKAAAGGGGRGMREVRDHNQFQEQLEGARREALAAFGDAAVLLERLVEGARHVEVQVFGDQHGTVVHLGERDCSIQRRHQKVFEESPSPAVDANLRRRMGEAAVRAAPRVSYTNAGTVEFLLAPNGDFYFLEMNTRLQVEHPVTELTTGVDLVKLQLEVATGAPLPFDQAAVMRSGHAIEVRLYAEDPANGYLPSSGRLLRFRMPQGADVRVDAGFSAGDTITPYYDALLAKIIVRGADREEAVRNLVAALSDTDIDGVTTNLALLQRIASSPQFGTGQTTVQFLDEHVQALMTDVPRSLQAQQIELGAAGYLLTGGWPGSGAPDPWDRAGPWRIGGAERPLPLRIDGRDTALMARPGMERGDWTLVVAGEARAVTFERLSPGELLMRVGATIVMFDAELGSDGLLIHHEGAAYHASITEPPSPDAAAAEVASVDGSRRLTAPMPGTIAKLHIAVGDVVQVRQTLAVLEAMKMEHAIQAAVDGRVKAVHCAEGERVTAGALLIELEPAT